MMVDNLVPEALPAGPGDLSSVEPPPTAEEWDALINLIGMTSDGRAKMSAPVDVRERPMLVLPDRRLVLVDISNGLDTLWDAFERAAKTDQVFFEDYRKRKSEWLEGRVITYLFKLFPPHTVYQNLTYPDPDKTDGSTTELDAAVLWRPFLVLVEAKAKQFRLESQLGDIGRLRTDIKANVEDAFDQARRAARYVNDNPTPIFTESSGGRKLAVQKDRLRRTYLLTVSLHRLAGLATKLSLFEDLGLFRDHEYPLSISIADLETVVQFCDGPDVFLHYIERRLSTQKESLVIEANELDLPGAYLQTRLQPSRLWERDGTKPNAVWLVGYSTQFDEWYNFERGDQSTPPDISLEIPAEIKDILSQLRKRDDDVARWIAFALLDFSDQVLRVLAEAFKDLQTAQLVPGMFRRLVRKEGETVVVIMASRDLTRDHLQERTQIRALIEKYRHKAQRCIGFGVMVADPSQLFHCAVWSDETWEFDQLMEDALVDEPPSIPAPDTKLPGRNEPCTCGSGRKFKKCCLRRFEEDRRRLGSLNSRS